MKITAIKPYPVRIGHRNQLIVKVETDAGLYGGTRAGSPAAALIGSAAFRYWEAPHLRRRDGSYTNW